MNTSNNQKYKDTECKIETALLKLCTSYSPNKITVIQICSQANINRSTFYAHYLDIPDLIQKTGKRHINNMMAFFQHEEDIIGFFVNHEKLLHLLTYLKENKEFFHIYVNYSSYEQLHKSFSKLWEHGAREYMKEIGLTDEDDMKYYFSFFEAGFFSLIGKWLSLGCADTPEHIGKILLNSIPSHIRFPADQVV
ncbi:MULTISPECIES: TetR/AcrR family transcriptional regulator [Blautia]|uniref:TetR/AcrR family transcriptional regulator n=1 Tax=Blautia TaxID=572511 RepID=UPI00138FB67F|nr:MULTISPECIES: TetR-like C-terminal domain-containing protein [Blautia]